MSMPRYASDAIMNQGQGGFGGFGGQMLGGGIGQFLSGMFGNSGAPFDQAMNQYNQFNQNAQNAQNPFINMGHQAIGQYQDWLNGQKDPSGFINKMMGNYQESPYAKYEQQQGLRAAQNMGSAGGMGGSGSTSLMNYAQQNAQNISSKDMNQWLQNVLGINTQYGQGLNNEIGYGQNSANNMTNFYNNMAGKMGDAAYGKQAGENQDFNNMLGGGLGIIGSFFDHG